MELDFGTIVYVEGDTDVEYIVLAVSKTYITVVCRINHDDGFSYSIRSVNHSQVEVA